MVQALAQLGVNSDVGPRESRITAANEDRPNGVTSDWTAIDNGKDYYVTRDGVRYAGMHLLIDLWGATNLDDLDLVEDTLRQSAIAGGATILHAHLHHFQPNGGISGVLVLAESHISIHTWPERGYAALDVFMCGDCEPHRALPILKEAFKPSHITLSESKRGLMP